MRYFFKALLTLGFCSSVSAQSTQNSGYVHKWIAAPEIRGADVYSGHEQLFKSSEGRLAVVVFTASWCEPCLKITPELIRIEERFSRVGVDFFYVFSHDSASDAKASANKSGLKKAVLSNQEVLTFFHNPELPSLFYIDRRGWLFHKQSKPEPKDLASLTELLGLLSSF